MDRALTTMAWVWATLAVVALVTVPFTGTAGRLAAIGITPTLSSLGLAIDGIEWTAEQALGIERLIKNNPRTIDLAAMRRLVRAAYDGDLAASAQ